MTPGIEVESMDVAAGVPPFGAMRAMYVFTCPAEFMPDMASNDRPDDVPPLSAGAHAIDAYLSAGRPSGTVVSCAASAKETRRPAAQTERRIVRIMAHHRGEGVAVRVRVRAHPAGMSSRGAPVEPAQHIQQFRESVKRARGRSLCRSRAGA